MPYVTSRKMLLDAQAGGYAVGAFNIENMEMAIAVVSAAKELGTPIMIQTTPGSVSYASLTVFVGMVRHLAQNSAVDIALHLDHSSSCDLAYAALYEGYSSVMIDGSKLDLDANIALTRSAVEMARDIPVEGELGTVGGKEDTTVSSGCSYTDPEDAVRFVKETGVSSLAVGIGTAHGIYVGTPVLDVERLSAIRKRLIEENCDVPLVLHGASGLSTEAVRECVKRGICKVNFATELRQAYTSAVRATLDSDLSIYDPKKYGKAAIAAVKEAVKTRILELR